jgi:hypothetical protein
MVAWRWGYWAVLWGCFGGIAGLPGNAAAQHLELPSLVAVHSIPATASGTALWQAVAFELPVRWDSKGSSGKSRAGTDGYGLEAFCLQRSMMVQGVALRDHRSPSGTALLPVAFEIIERGHGLRIQLPASATAESTLMVHGIVPAGWRGGLWEVRSSGARAWVGMYAADDREAMLTAQQFSRREAALLASAARHQEAVRHAQFPTPFHQWSAALELYQPPVPKDWLEQVRFERADVHAEAGLRKLPVDLRVAVLDYRDALTALEQLARPPATQLLSLAD